MEKNSLGTLKHRGNTYSLTDIRKGIKTWTPTENKILDARCGGVAFRSTSGEIRKTFLDDIMLSGAAATGCALPNTDFFANVISNEIDYMLENFVEQDIAASEVILALRMNSQADLKIPKGVEYEQVPFSGYCFHITFLSQVLSNYLRVRNFIDRKLQNAIDGY
jgi:hypothetical protein